MVKMLVMRPTRYVTANATAELEVSCCRTASVTGSPWAGLSVVVSNPLEVGSIVVEAPQSGLGLIGLAERTALVGGRMTHRITPAREFVVEAWLPWPA